VAQESLEILVFEVGGQRYGLPAADIREIVRAVAIVPLPKAPAIVEGIINLRGRLVPVLDLRTRFGLPAKPVEPADHLIVAWAGPRLVALRVDRATHLVRLDPAEVEDAKGVVPGVEYVAWVAKLPFDLVLIHDLRTFLSRAESVTLDEALPVSQAAGEGGGPS
jgi:purine-binding chemotaxis protein CheW